MWWGTTHLVLAPHSTLRPLALFHRCLLLLLTQAGYETSPPFSTFPKLAYVANFQSEGVIPAHALCPVQLESHLYPAPDLQWEWRLGDWDTHNIMNEQMA